MEMLGSFEFTNQNTALRKTMAEGGEGICVLPFASLCKPSLPGINVFVHMKAESDFFPPFDRAVKKAL